MTTEQPMPFHEWKTEFRRLEAPRVRPTEDYHQQYGCYVQKHRQGRVARPAPSRPPNGGA